MHLIPTIPGGWSPNSEGVFYIDQTPGDIVFFSAADTELNSLNGAYYDLSVLLHRNGAGTADQSPAVPSLRMANLVYLKQELTIDKYLEEVVSHSKLVICRMLGGKSYYPYLFESLCSLCRFRKIPLILLPGYNTPDFELIAESSVNIHVLQEVLAYFNAGGKGNLSNCLQYLFNNFFGYSFSVQPPIIIQDLFLYQPVAGILDQEQINTWYWSPLAKVVIIVYQAHFLANNLEPVYFIFEKLEQQGSAPIVAFINHLRDEQVIVQLFNLVSNQGNSEINIIINTTSFSIKAFQEQDNPHFIFSKLKVPVIQAIFASPTHGIWKENLFGLPPTDIAINIALPEVDGKIITTAVSFKSSTGKDPFTESDILKYATYEEGCNFVVKFCNRWISLQKKNNQEKKIALILPNYPNKDSRLANGVGLDTPESCVRILKALKDNNYNTGEFIPFDSSELIQLITHFITNDQENNNYKPYQAYISKEDFYLYYQQLSSILRSKVEAQWGKPEEAPNYSSGLFALPGVLLGNIFVSIQPARGYHQDPKAIYHSPDLAPPFDYLAYYFWVNQIFRADAVIHVGKHGNLEWLPGKSVVLDPETCFPLALFGAVPHFYPFIVNDPGEGTQAKRRNHAVIIDHLIPPMTRAETYGDLTKLEHLIDEYYEAYNLDARRTQVIKTQIKLLVQKTQLDSDLQIASNDIDELLVKLDGYLCELKEAQIRDGLHIFGQVPQGEQLVDLLVALHRVSSISQQGITQVLAKELGLAVDPLNCDYSSVSNTTINEKYCRTNGDIVEALELILKEELSRLVDFVETNGSIQSILTYEFSPVLQSLTATKSYIKNIIQDTLPKITATSGEITNLLKGLNGEYIASGPSGAPTRGNIEVLPTGRNFYSVDVRSIATPTAYALGVKSANLIIDRYLQENGDYPESIGLSVWGTSTMRTGGDDIAQAFALMGVKPLWQGVNRRVSDFEIIPLYILGRPRIDVLLRISGFFRDAFPDVIALFNTVVERLVHLDEPEEQNPLRKKYLKEKKEWQDKGLPEEKAEKRATYRVFGSKPGAYGAGLQAMIDDKSWDTRDDLANVYINWSGYAYGADRVGESVHEVFKKRLSDVQIVMHNQDNREHDILDSDDYYQFQGGMANAVNTLTGKTPDIFFGDHSRPEHPRVKTLKEELLKVYRSRVVNPKWIEGVKRHGYKGAFEMSATIDYLFAYDATTGLVEDFMYEGITQEYLFNKENKDFIEKVNPWALKDMTERMLEAIQRGMWKTPDPETLEKLQKMFIELE